MNFGSHSKKYVRAPDKQDDAYMACVCASTQLTIGFVMASVHEPAASAAPMCWYGGSFSPGVVRSMRLIDSYPKKYNPFGL